MSNSVETPTFSAPEPVNGYFSAGNRALGKGRSSTPTNARSRMSAVKAKRRGREELVGPTPERLAKDDIIRSTTGMHRSLPIIERLRDGGKLDHDPRVNQGMFEAADKLRRHFDSCLIGVKAQDLNRIVGGGSDDDLTQEEGWVHHFDTFRTACKLMGWSDEHPHRGAGRIVVAVVCYETIVFEAAKQNIEGLADTTALKAVGMDRLRDGLFALAQHWRMC